MAAQSSLGRRRQTVRRGERGETLVEFAFASLIFFTFIFGVLQFGLAIWNYNLVSGLAQDGARYAAVHGQKSGSPKTLAQLDTYIQGLAYGLTVSTTGSDNPSVIGPGLPVTVTVSYTLATGGGVLPLWNIPISSTAKMTVTR